MAKLFNCDIVTQKHTGHDVYKKGEQRYKVNAFITSNMKADTKNSFFKKNGIQSVFKHMRTVEGVYAEMDLVRASTARTAENIIRNFDLSCCMNWYDGDDIYSMDPESIMDPANHSARLNFSYVPLYLGLSPINMTRVCNERILKYIMRGYRISYVNPNSGEVTEITPADVPNALRHILERSNKNQRPKILQKAMLKMSAKRRTKFVHNHPSLKNMKSPEKPEKIPKIKFGSLD
jgi:hypothetical protein